MPFIDLATGGRQYVSASANPITTAFGGGRAPAQSNPITNAFGGLGGGTGVTTFDLLGFGSNGLSTGTPFANNYAATGVGSTNAGRSPTINTTNVDGGAGFINSLSGLSAAVLEGLGGQRDAPAPYLQNAAFEAPRGTSPVVVWAAVAAVALGVYYVGFK